MFYRAVGRRFIPTYVGYCRNADSLGAHARQRPATSWPNWPPRVDLLLGPVVRSLQTHGSGRSGSALGGRRDRGQLRGGQSRSRSLSSHRAAIRRHCSADYRHYDPSRTSARLDAGTGRGRRFRSPTQSNCSRCEAAWGRQCPNTNRQHAPCHGRASDDASAVGTCANAAQRRAADDWPNAVGCQWPYARWPNAIIGRQQSVAGHRFWPHRRPICRHFPRRPDAVSHADRPAAVCIGGRFEHATAGKSWLSRSGSRAAG